MATATGFKEANKVLNAPAGQEEAVGNLPTVSFPGLFTGSVWELSNAELHQVFSTGKIFLGVCAGGETQPPVFVAAYTPGLPQRVAADFREQLQAAQEPTPKNDAGNGETKANGN